MSKVSVDKTMWRFERLLDAVSEKLENCDPVEESLHESTSGVGGSESEVSSLSGDFVHFLRRQCSEPRRGGRASSTIQSRSVYGKQRTSTEETRLDSARERSMLSSSSGAEGLVSDRETRKYRKRALSPISVRTSERPPRTKSSSRTSARADKPDKRRGDHSRRDM